MSKRWYAERIITQSTTQETRMLTIGIDTGGTFTDFIWKEDGRSGEYKLLSTPDNPA